MSFRVLLNFFALSSFHIKILLTFISLSIALSSSSSSSPYDLSSYSGNKPRSFKKAQYGSFCNSSIKCDIHSLLTCEDSTCQCLYQDAMAYSTEVGTCVSLVNEICGYLETKKVFINCGPNSQCDKHQGVCKCIAGYTESDRTCVEQKNFGEPCHSDSECLTDLSLICFEEICQCNPEQHVPFYSPTTASHDDMISSALQPFPSTTNKSNVKCVALAGQPCTRKTGCVLKASCTILSENDNGDGGNVLSSSYGWIHPGVCRCDAGYEMDHDESGFCRGKYASHCDALANVSCSEKFQCLNGICECKYPDDQIYDKNAEKCISISGGPCSMLSPEEEENRNETGRLYNSTASCGKFMECENKTCVCMTGFVRNPDRGCDLAYQQPCTGETMNKCDKAAGLHCVQGKCTCKDDSKFFDEVAGICLGKAGSSCILTTKDDSTDYSVKYNTHTIVNAQDDHCAESLLCQSPRSQLDGLTMHGVCKQTTVISNEAISIDKI